MHQDVLDYVFGAHELSFAAVKYMAAQKLKTICSKTCFPSKRLTSRFAGEEY